MHARSPSAVPVTVTKAASYCVPAPLIGPPHVHPGEWQIVYVVSGRGIFIVGENRHEVCRRDLYLVKPGPVHASEDDDGASPDLWEIRLAIGEGACLPFALSDLPDMLRDVGEPALLETMRQLIDEYSARQPNWQWLCAMLAQELMLRIGRLAAGGAAPMGRRSGRLHEVALAHVRRHIHFHFHEPLTVDELAREAGMSSRRFAAVFRQVCGRSPMDYVIEVRLDRAAELLREGRLTVSEVAERTGFSSVHYFSRIFRRRRGVAPSDYLRAKH